MKGKMKSLDMRKKLIIKEDKITTLFFTLAITIALITIVCQVKEALSYDIWVDEAFSLRMIRHPYRSMIKLTAQDVHPPLYYIILKFGVESFRFLLGNVSEIFLAKLVSIIPFILIHLLNVFWIRHRWGMEVSAFFALCIAGAPQLTEYAVDIRMYGFGFLFVMITFLIMFEMIRSESYSWRKSIPFLCFSVMAAYTHYFALVSVGIAYVFLLVDVLKKQRQFSELKKVVILIIIAILCYLPWIFVLLQQIASVTTSYWIQKITAETVWGYALFVFDNVFCLVIFIYVVSRTLYKKKVDEHRKFVLLGSISCTIGTVLVGILASILIRPVFVERYMVPSLGCLWFAFCLALSAIRDNEYKYAIVLLAFVFCLNHISNFVVNEDQAKTESERLMTEVSEDNVLYVFENARARNVMAAMTGEMCYQFKDNIDELSIAVYGNIGTINTVEEIQMFIENGMSAYWVETVDENSLMPENEMEACGLQYKEIGEFYIENTIAKQHLIIYKLE